MANNFGIELNENGYFISYLSEDKDRVAKLCKELSTQLPIWNDGGIEIGGNWRKELAEHIGSCKGVIFFVTKKVFTTENYMTKEYKLATYNNKDVLFVFLDPIRPEELPPDGQAYYAEFVDLQYLDACDLSNKQIVEKIVAFCNGDKSIIGYKPSYMRRYSKLFIYLFLCACIGIGIMFFRGNSDKDVIVETTSHQADSNSDVEIVLSESLMFDDKPIPYVNGLFLHTTIENYSDKNLLIKSVETNITDMSPIEKPVIDYTAIEDGDTVKLFAYNSGWKDSDEIQKSMFYKKGYSDTENRDINEIANVNFNTNLNSIKSGEMEGYASLSFHKDAMKVDEVYEIHIDDGQQEHEKSVITDTYTISVELLEDGSISVIRGGLGASVFYKDKTYIDVDTLKNQIPLTINHTSPDFLQQVEAGNNLILGSLFVPSKSCQITCSSRIVLGQDTYDSEKGVYLINVPRFQEYLWNAKVDDLKNVDITDHNIINEIAKSYYFDSKSYFDLFNVDDTSK